MPLAAENWKHLKYPLFHEALSGCSLSRLQGKKEWLKNIEQQRRKSGVEICLSREERLAENTPGLTLGDLKKGAIGFCLSYFPVSGTFCANNDIFGHLSSILAAIYIFNLSTV